jgi:hypothetical protein
VWAERSSSDAGGKTEAFALSCRILKGKQLCSGPRALLNIYIDDKKSVEVAIDVSILQTLVEIAETDTPSPW